MNYTAVKAAWDRVDRALRRAGKGVCPQCDCRMGIWHSELCVAVNNMRKVLEDERVGMGSGGAGSGLVGTEGSSGEGSGSGLVGTGGSGSGLG